eukprot:6187602-Pleurochrysis_carterae.AAC.1
MAPATIESWKLLGKASTCRSHEYVNCNGSSLERRHSLHTAAMVGALVRSGMRCRAGASVQGALQQSNSRSALSMLPRNVRTASNFCISGASREGRAIYLDSQVAWWSAFFSHLSVTARRRIPTFDVELSWATSGAMHEFPIVAVR